MAKDSVDYDACGENQGDSTEPSFAFEEARYTDKEQKQSYCHIQVAYRISRFCHLISLDTIAGGITIGPTSVRCGRYIVVQVQATRRCTHRSYPKYNSWSGRRHGSAEAHHAEHSA